ncbi:MAG: glutamate synthase subunit alpha, partial [Pseudonocardiaceae bacterium]
MADLPGPHGLYRPDFEHDACGVAFVVDIHGRRSHRMVRLGIDSLCHMEHRGASGAETNTGDGAGILVQIPDRFYRAVCHFRLPPLGGYAAGIGFLPADPIDAKVTCAAIDALVADEGLDVLGWRAMPTNDSAIGSIARSSMPGFYQLFVGAGRDADGLPNPGGIELERRAFMLRKRIRREVDGIYFPSLSTRTVVYKGMLTAPQMASFWP